MLRCEHIVPGRLRLKAWPSSPAFLQAVRQSLLAMPGIRSVDARITTGSLVVHHDASVNPAQVLVQVGAESLQPQPPRTDTHGNRLGEAVAEVLVQTAMEHLLGKPASLLLNVLL